jgi:hypothetical protein
MAPTFGTICCHWEEVFLLFGCAAEEPSPVGMASSSDSSSSASSVPRLTRSITFSHLRSTNFFFPNIPPKLSQIRQNGAPNPENQRRNFKCPSDVCDDMNTMKHYNKNGRM